MTNLSPALMRFGDVSVRLSVELGRTDMPLRDVLSLGQGSVVALNRLTDELLDITANGKVVAQGEVIAEGGKFALRIVNLVGEDPSAAGAAPPMPMSPGMPDIAAPPRTMASGAMPTGVPPAAPPPTGAMPDPTPAAAVSTPPAYAPPPEAKLQAQAESEPIADPSAAESAAQTEEPTAETQDAPSPSDTADAGNADIDDLLDSTLDELTDALDDITPSDGEDESGDAGS